MDRIILNSSFFVQFPGLQMVAPRRRLGNIYADRSADGLIFVVDSSACSQEAARFRKAPGTLGLWGR